MDTAKELDERGGALPLNHLSSGARWPVAFCGHVMTECLAQICPECVATLSPNRLPYTSGTECTVVYCDMDLRGESQ